MNARLTGFIASLTMLAACAGDDVDLGSGPLDRSTIELVEFAGSWDGYAEGYDFRDGSDRVRLMLDSEGNGVLEVGDSESAVPHPTHGYWITDINTGFSYPITGASVWDSRLQAGADHLDFFDEYCSSLQPIAVPDGFSCGPTPIPDCDAVCVCDGVGCRTKTREEAVGRPSSLPGGKSIHLDGALEDGGQKLIGTLVLEGFAPTAAQQPDTNRITVRLNRI